MSSEWLLCDDDDNSIVDVDVVDPFGGKVTISMSYVEEEPTEEEENSNCRKREVLRDFLFSFLIILTSILSFVTFVSVDIVWTRILLSNIGGDYVANGYVSQHGIYYVNYFTLLYLQPLLILWGHYSVRVVRFIHLLSFIIALWSMNFLIRDPVHWILPVMPVLSVMFHSYIAECWILRKRTGTQRQHQSSLLLFGFTIAYICIVLNAMLNAILYSSLSLRLLLYQELGIYKITGDE